MDNLLDRYFIDGEGNQILFSTSYCPKCRQITPTTQRWRHDGEHLNCVETCSSCGGTLTHEIVVAVDDKT